mmetsp:Transcript_8555/g.25962  ORF Transcript_8555/g.25962 Transcript_8555/m.25962 type:complete len:223 (+) Transcript_8555:573-1241(+)
MPISCNTLTASSTCSTKGFMTSSRAGPGGGSPSHQLKRSPCVASEATTYVVSLSRNTPFVSQTNEQPKWLSSFTRAMSHQGRSGAVGYFDWNSFGPQVTQEEGMRLTATRTSSSAPRYIISSTRPLFRMASCNLPTSSNLPGSQGFTASDASCMSFSRSLPRMGRRPSGKFLAPGELSRLALLSPAGKTETGSLAMALPGLLFQRLPSQKPNIPSSLIESWV